jgi:DNA-binding transcriptional ArsR family regulator
MTFLHLDGKEKVYGSIRMVAAHLKVLNEAGLLDRGKRGVWVYYCARTQALAAIGVLIGCNPL